MRIFTLTLFIIMCENAISDETSSANTEGYITVTCSGESNCANSASNAMTSMGSSGSINSAFGIDDTKEWNSNIENPPTTEIDTTMITISTTTLPVLAQTPAIKQKWNNIDEQIITNLTLKTNPIRKSKANICTCDMTILQCDINCCCDVDCTEFHLAIFSHCIDHQTEKYDNRYCYTKNLFQRNNTVFILEKLNNNLFCIAYDNLPPVYSKSNSINIESRRKFDEIMMKNVKREFIWVKNKPFVIMNPDGTVPYRDTDTIWQLQSKSLKPIKLPTSGFTNECTFRKNIQYLKDINSHCLQTRLSNDNNDLFDEMYHNFTVISSPIFFNSTYMSSLNENCPKNVCISIERKYCSNSLSFCDIMKPLTSSCVNGSCKNIVKRVHYIITHNGTMGIQKVRVNIILANVSKSFYQHFDIEYRWDHRNEQHIYHRSGNPGYIIGKPIIIGTLKPNTTDDIVIGVNNSNTIEYYLTVPSAKKDGKCNENNRHIVNLGENVKLTCHVTLETSNFTIDSCVKLREKILTTYFHQSYMNFTDIEHYKIYISKLGNITDENSNNISNWNQILFSKVPNGVLDSERTNEQLYCSGLHTTLMIDVLYSLLPKPNIIDNYKIIGVGVTLSAPESFNWPKCISRNCTDILDLNLITYVKFHDISTPELYYYAGGPNLDISLPYDFYYPFLSGKCGRVESNSFIVINTIIIITISMYM